MKRVFQRISFAAAVLVTGYLLATFFNHPPKESSDWASWVQAFGSIAAIGVAIGVSYWQHEKDRGQSEQRERDEIRSMLISLHDEIRVTVDEFERQAAEAIRGTSKGAVATSIYTTDNPFKIYDAHLDRIGKIKSDLLRQQIICTYARLDSFLITLRINNDYLATYQLARQKHIENPSELQRLECDCAYQNLNAYGDEVRDIYKDCLGITKDTMAALLSAAETGLM